MRLFSPIRSYPVVVCSLLPRRIPLPKYTTPFAAPTCLLLPFLPPLPDIVPDIVLSRLLMTSKSRQGQHICNSKSSVTYTVHYRIFSCTQS